MSNADRSQYAEAVTRLSEGELRDVLSATEPPVCLLGGWAVHLHVTEGFRDAYDRSYIGSRDIDLGIHIDPEWSQEELAGSSVATTLNRIETELEYRRGRFGFYQEFHRETGARLDDEAARGEPPHNVFRLDIDIMPDTAELDGFEKAFGFRPPAEPLLKPVFTDDAGEPLAAYVDWNVPTQVRIAPVALLGAMKIRSAPQRDKSHKLLKDLADLHALLWYVTDYDEIRSAVQDRVSDEDRSQFVSIMTDDVFERSARLIDVDPTIVEQSIEGVFT
ncbi:MAG: hypothetical protein ACI8VE_000247 [Natrialbaceae archaeon]|jgi:hypothetical protein